jgi:ribA/ribD-fused uncharacterized protein
MNVVNRAQLMDYVDQGHPIDYLFFWGSRSAQHDVIDKHCLSQFFPAHFTIDATVYRTAEHYMMSQKARLFGDHESLQKILKTPSPLEAKKLGRQIKGFDDVIWAVHRVKTVETGTMAKFSQNAKLKEFLLSTKNKILVEASPFDTVWGIGLREDDPDVYDPKKWRGLNLLGFVLMNVRNTYR